METQEDKHKNRVSDTFKKLNTEGVQNGNITKFRIIASGLIGLLTIGGGTFLLYMKVDVPQLYWYIAIGALSGVVGVDLLASVIKSRGN